MVKFALKDLRFQNLFIYNAIESTMMYLSVLGFYHTKQEDKEITQFNYF